MDYQVLIPNPGNVATAELGKANGADSSHECWIDQGWAS